jgi:cytochrome c-type biogenesis protein CcmH/NrfF
VRLVLTALAALALLAPAARAATPRTTLNDVEDEVMCVTCNVPLNIAQSPQADRERAFIQRLVDEGLTKDQIKRRLKAVYGPNVLALPSSKGFNFAAYAVPIALVLLMLVAVAILVRRWRRTGGPGPPSPPAPEPAADPEDERRLDEDLARYGA